jgi:hypothetical protein
MRTTTETNNKKFEVLQENMCTMQQGIEARMDTVMDVGKGMSEVLPANDGGLSPKHGSLSRRQVG